MAVEPTTKTTGVGPMEFEKPLRGIEQSIDELEAEQERTGEDRSQSIRQLRTELTARIKRTYADLTPWQTVMVARHPQRPLVPDYVRMIFRDFCPLAGDRLYRDDPAMLTGFARIGGHKVVLVGHNKGKTTSERLKTNFGMAHPEGYRKALAKMRLAAKFGLPVVCLIDTAGAFPGIGAEERGIAGAIAVNLMEISRLRTPIVCVVIGEGGSGGAIGIGVGDRVAMLQHAYYSVISPEGCAAILFKTGDQAQRAAGMLRLTSRELAKLDVVDDIVPEPLGGAHRDPVEAATHLEHYLVDTLGQITQTPIETLMQRRYQRLRTIGRFFESTTTATSPTPSSAPAVSTNGKKSDKVRIVARSTRPAARRPVRPGKDSRR